MTIFQVADSHASSPLQARNLGTDGDLAVVVVVPLVCVVGLAVLVSVHCCDGHPDLLLRMLDLFMARTSLQSSFTSFLLRARMTLASPLNACGGFRSIRLRKMLSCKFLLRLLRQVVAHIHDENIEVTKPSASDDVDEAFRAMVQRLALSDEAAAILLHSLSKENVRKLLDAERKQSAKAAPCEPSAPSADIATEPPADYGVNDVGPAAPGGPNPSAPPAAIVTGSGDREEA